MWLENSADPGDPVRPWRRPRSPEKRLGGRRLGASFPSLPPIFPGEVDSSLSVGENRGREIVVEDLVAGKPEGEFMDLYSAGRCGCCAAVGGCVFGNLPEELNQQFREIVEVRRYSAGSTVFYQGDESHGVFNVHSGAVRLLRLEANGRQVTVRIVPAAGILGLAEVTAGTPYQLTAEAVEDCILEYAPRRRFVPFLLDNPQVTVELLIWLSQEFQGLQVNLGDVVSRPTLSVQLLRQLRTLGEACGETTGAGVELHPCFTGQDLADGLGCSRQWVSKLLKDLEGQGLIERHGRRIVLTPFGLKVDLEAQEGGFRPEAAFSSPSTTSC